MEAVDGQPAAVAAGLPLSKITLVVFGRSTSARQVVHLEHLECSHHSLTSGPGS